MRARVSLITLGVSDLARSRRFYEALGLTVAQAVEGEVAFLQLAGGVVLAPYPRVYLARDAGMADRAGADGRDGFGGISLANNVRSAGAPSVKRSARTSRGGYVGYFTDPDGHLWEIAWNPFWPLDAQGRVSLPD